MKEREKIHENPVNNLRQRLESASDQDLQLYLLQLVQALRYEHDSEATCFNALASLGVMGISGTGMIRKGQASKPCVPISSLAFFAGQTFFQTWQRRERHFVPSFFLDLSGDLTTGGSWKRGRGVRCEHLLFLINKHKGPLLYLP